MSRWIQGRIDASPEDCRYDGESLAKIAACYEKLLDADKAQAAGFLMARGGKIFAHQTAGRRLQDPASEPFRPEHIKRIASITKIVTATAIMQLVEEGHLWLEMPVKSILPEFDTPIHGGITIKQLLTHTSGLVADQGYYNEPFPIDSFEASRKEDWLKGMVLAGPLHGEVGQQWGYCTKGFGVLAEIVSRVSGRHYHDYVQERVFKAIGMESSFFEVPEKLWPEVLMIADWESLAIKRAYERKGMPQGGGGGYSTLYDLFRLGQCYLNGGTLDGKRLVSKKAAAEMTRNQLDGVPSYHWGARLKNYRHGLGWGFYCDSSFVGPRTYNHEGWGWCSLFVDPDEEFVLVTIAATPADWSAELQVYPRSIAFAGLL
jgi:CubicO group peptidase (beta-lactamase class C family)